MKMKVRPFTRPLHAPGRPLAMQVTGRLERNAFVFNAFGEGLSIPASAVSEDEHGPFGLLQPQEIEIKPHWWLRVRPEYDDGFDLPGCEISLTYEPDLGALQLELARQGKNPDDYNVLGPSRAGVLIGFSSSGDVNGDACVGDGRAFDLPLA
jgi:hypothetical protein